MGNRDVPGFLACAQSHSIYFGQFIPVYSLLLRLVGLEYGFGDILELL